MPEPKLTRTQRHLPQWERPGSTYFLTFRLKQGKLTRDERKIVFDHIRSGDKRFYRLYALVAMPDHVHMLAKPNNGISLSRMMQGTKGVTAWLVNASRKTHGPLWLGESYDRIIRDEAEAVEMQNYIYENSVRAGMVARPEDDPFVYRAALW